MDALFGDATTNLGTPATPGTPSLGPVGTQSARGRGPPLLNPSSAAIPGLNINPPDVVDRKADHAQENGSGVRSWFSKLFGRGSSLGTGEYAPLGQQDE